MGRAEDTVRARLAQRDVDAAAAATEIEDRLHAEVTQMRAEIADLAGKTLLLLERLNYPGATLSKVETGSTGLFKKSPVFEERASWLIANNQESSDVASRWWSVHLLSDGTFQWLGRGIGSGNHVESAEALGAALGDGRASALSLLRPTLSGLRHLHDRLEKNEPA